MTLPQSFEAEASVLGSLMIERDAIAEVAGRLSPDAFADPNHRRIYHAMLDLWRMRRPCDPVTLQERLEFRGCFEEIGGYAKLVDLMATVPSAVHLEHYAGIVADCAARRAVIDAAAGIVADAHAGDVDVEAGVRALRDAAGRFALSARDGDSLAERLADHRDKVLRRWAGELRELTVPTGVRTLDERTYGGFKAGELVYVGGRPGSGKTSLALQMARAAAESGHRALIVELEMSREALLNRAIASAAGVPFGVAYQQIGDVLQRDRWLEASEQLETLPLSLETDLSTVDRIAAYCERAAAEQPVEAIFIDHLDYLSEPDLARLSPEQRTAETSKRLRRLANNLQVPVIVLAQLNRAVEAHPPFKPNLAHFRYSGAVEQDADFALLLWRRKYYVDKGMLDSHVDDDYDGSSSRHKVELMVAKHRNGDVGVVGLAWEPATMSFHERIAA